ACPGGLRVFLRGQLSDGGSRLDGIGARRGARPGVWIFHHRGGADRQLVALGGRQPGESAGGEGLFGRRVLFSLRLACAAGGAVASRSAVPPRGSERGKTGRPGRAGFVAKRHSQLAIPMNLPDYFLADLPAEATLSATMISEA